MLVFRSISLLRLPQWRLIGLLAAVLWAAEIRQPVICRRPPASEGEVVRIGTAHRNPTPATVLDEQTALNREAVSIPEFAFSGGLLGDVALLSDGLKWLTRQRLALHQILPVRPSAVPNEFRLRLLLAALSPNAP